MSDPPLVLVVDDEPGVRRLVGAQVALLGFDTELAADAAAALEVVRELTLQDLPSGVLDGETRPAPRRSVEVVRHDLGIRRIRRRSRRLTPRAFRIVCRRTPAISGHEIQHACANKRQEDRGHHFLRVHFRLLHRAFEAR